MRQLQFFFFFLILSTGILPAQSNIKNCDTSVFYFVRQMPCYVGDYDQILKQININTPRDIKDQINKVNPTIAFSIDCNGKVGVKISDDNLSFYENTVAQEFNKLQWTPGFYEGVPVNVSSIAPVYIVDNRIKIPNPFPEIKGTIHKAKIFDEDTNEAISNAKILTSYNNRSTFTNDKGETFFYCEPDASIEVSHINYTPIKFSALENTYIYTIKMKKAFYVFEDLNLIKCNPEKLPKQDVECGYQDWNEKGHTKIIFLGRGDYFNPEMAQFSNSYDCFQNYLCKKFILPRDAILNNYSDTVTVEFIIDREGIPNNIRLSKELKYNLDKVIEELFIGMPKWKPATQAYTSVEQEFEIRIMFGVNKYWEKRQHNLLSRTGEINLFKSCSDKVLNYEE